MFWYAERERFRSIVLNVMIHDLLIHRFPIDQATISEFVRPVPGDREQMSADAGILLLSVPVNIVLWRGNRPQDMDCLALRSILQGKITSA